MDKYAIRVKKSSKHKKSTIDNFPTHHIAQNLPDWNNRDRITGKYKIAGRKYALQRQEQLASLKKKLKEDRPTYTTSPRGRKKYDFSHLQATKHIDIRKYIAIPKSKEAKLSKDELKKQLEEEAVRLSIPMV